MPSYFAVGLVPKVDIFWKFLLCVTCGDASRDVCSPPYSVLVLFSLAASAAVLFISIAIKDTGVANLVGTLTMLFNLLFAGLLINRDRIPVALRWALHGSFMHAAFEALLINELKTLSLTEVVSLARSDAAAPLAAAD